MGGINMPKNINFVKTVFSVIVMIGLIITGTPSQAQIIINHTCTDLSQIPPEWIGQAQTDLHIAYQHTSHGSQLTSGMNIVDSLFPGSPYDFSDGGGPGVLDYRDYAMQSYAEPPSTYMDLGHNGWETATRNYLNANTDANIAMWAWCGQLSGMGIADVTDYLTNMTTLENEYPQVTFVYMTGHLDGTGSSGTLHQNNNQIRDYCIDNQKILYDFADIERYDPDGNDYLDLGGGNSSDGCQYNGGSGNWCDEWCSSNQDPSQCSTCSSCAHSDCLNCWQKGKATWWMYARLAGWDGESFALTPTVTPTLPPGITLTPTIPPTEVPTPTSPPLFDDILIFEDDLNHVWNNWSFGTSLNMEATETVKFGNTSLAVTYFEAVGHLYFHSDITLDENVYSNLRFWIHGGTTGGQELRVTVVDGNDEQHYQDFFSVTPPQAGIWSEVVIPLSTFGNFTGINGFIWASELSYPQPVYYLDEIVLEKISHTTPTETLEPTPTLTATVPPPATETPTSTPTPVPTLVNPGSDLNGDGVVNNEDLQILMQDWHKKTE